MVRSSSQSFKVKKYPKAPVSEVIFGVTFSENFLSIRDLFDAQRTLSDEFTRLEIRPPIADEWMSGFQVTQELNPEISGTVLIRLRSDDGNWMCQIQANKIYFNWIRPDHEPVGNYPGYTAIYCKYGEALNALNINIPDIPSDKVKYYELSYHDRIEWQEYLDSLSDAQKIMRFKPPDIKTPEGFNNSFARYTYSYESLGGFGIFAMNTATAATGKQVLQFESTLRGITPHQSSDAWYNAAHKVQFDHFSRFFQPEILEQWS